MGWVKRGLGGKLILVWVGTDRLELAVADTFPDTLLACSHHCKLNSLVKGIKTLLACSHHCKLNSLVKGIKILPPGPCFDMIEDIRRQQDILKPRGTGKHQPEF